MQFCDTRAVPATVHAKTLQKAAAVLGGKQKLRAALRVPMSLLQAWLSGAERPPTHIFLKAVDLISAPPAPPKQDEMAGVALDAALKATGADMGNIQLVCPDGLRIVAQRGFDTPFLEYFACVVPQLPSSCGAAMKHGARVVVPEVASHPIFAGTQAAEVMAQARARACQSTPLVAKDGTMLGMLNTHYDRPYEPGARELEVIDQVARRAASWLEGGEF